MAKSHILIIGSDDAAAIDRVINTDDWMDYYSHLVERVIIHGPSYLKSKNFVSCPMTSRLKRFFRRLSTDYREDLYFAATKRFLEDDEEWDLQGYDFTIEQLNLETIHQLLELDHPDYCIRLEKTNKEQYQFVDDMDSFLL